jgi:hypothetical protein
MRTLAICLTLLAGAASAREVEGVQVAESMSLGGAALKLNGVGLRRATVFNVKVYVGALYLPVPSSDPEAIVRADEPKCVWMRFVRDVGKEKIMGAFHAGFERNVGAAARALEPGLLRVAAAIPREMKKGMQLAISYLPGRGTTVVSPAGEVTVEGKPLADAMLLTLLGTRPADETLKKALLGR